MLILRVLLPELKRRHPRQLMERVHKVAVILETDRRGNLLDRAFLVLDQQFLGLLNAESQQILIRADAPALAEQRAQMLRADMQRAGQAIQPEVRVAIGLLDQQINRRQPLVSLGQGGLAARLPELLEHCQERVNLLRSADAGEVEAVLAFLPIRLMNRT